MLEKEEGEEFAICEDGRFLVLGAAEEVVEQIRLEAEELAAGTDFECLTWLPLWLPESQAGRYTPQFIESFVDAVQVVAHKLASPRCYLASTIEELAAHAILGYARDLLGDDVDAAVRWGIADAERAGADAEELQAEVFEDEDALMLFDPSFDGIENSTIVASMGAVGLAFDDWFKPYPLARSWL
jgi:hypothetical protein